MELIEYNARNFAMRQTRLEEAQVSFSADNTLIRFNLVATQNMGLSLGSRVSFFQDKKYGDWYIKPNTPNGYTLRRTEGTLRETKNGASALCFGHKDLVKLIRETVKVQGAFTIPVSQAENGLWMLETKQMFQKPERSTPIKKKTA